MNLGDFESESLTLELHSRLLFHGVAAHSEHSFSILILVEFLEINRDSLA